VADIPQGGGERCGAADALGDQARDGRNVAPGDGGNAGDHSAEGVQAKDQTGPVAAFQIESVTGQRF
jgi:hypothetical protein